MTFCYQCGQANTDEVRFCTKCRALINTRIPDSQCSEYMHQQRNNEAPEAEGAQPLCPPTTASAQQNTDESVPKCQQQNSCEQTPTTSFLPQPRFCVNCGTPIGDGARFCAQCGNPINASSPMVNQSQPAYHQPQDQNRVVTISREKKLASALCPYTVYVDDGICCVLQSGESQSFPITAGTHRIQVVGEGNEYNGGLPPCSNVEFIREVDGNTRFSIQTSGWNATITLRRMS